MKKNILGLLLAIAVAIPAMAQDATPRTTPSARDPYGLGKDWELLDSSNFMYDDSGETIPAYIEFFGGPDRAQIRVIQAQLSVLNARSFYDERVDNQDLYATNLGSATDQAIVQPKGCALSDSKQGTERLVGLRLGSSICVTDEGRFLWVSIEGGWRNPETRTNDPLYFSAATSALVELILQYPQREFDDEPSAIAASDLTATADAIQMERGDITPVAVDFGAVPTQLGIALPNNGDVASGCWTEDQRTTDGKQPLQWMAEPTLVIDPTQIYTAELVTNYGTMVWQLLPQASTSAVNSFVCLSRAGYYDGTPFHRVVDNFVIQGGDPTGTGTGGPGYTITDSPVVGDYSVGVVSMANTGQPNSSGSQFFINTADNTATFAENPSYINFARVISGQDTVDAIASVKKTDNGRGEISSPASPVILESLTIFEGGIPIIGMPTGSTGTPEVATPTAVSSGD